MPLPAYRITQYTRRKAKAAGLTVRAAKNRKKKLDVYRGKKKLASIGANGMKDYPAYMKTSLAVAKKRRAAYMKRHAKNNKTAGRLAKKLLW